ncbi:hypothetical protein [Desulfitobacterium chlororespirans]|uniref:Uncharacterized protein n=1 Tax=Desulfitobacterium chlororespirans DSM 11544 TaxID=1121395 RepID=A0A1M7S463_9FIRM|nr:hypothetical protein [Desulfitobacterium chlororespirans]SHN53256.1 hypothetical protein SAMN02745215_00512 [Desulfitobacterium chlororespirans DSM 11544]
MNTDNTPFIQANTSILDYFKENSIHQTLLMKGEPFFPQSLDTMWA